MRRMYSPLSASPGFASNLRASTHPPRNFLPPGRGLCAGGPARPYVPSPRPSPGKRRLSRPPFILSFLRLQHLETGIVRRLGCRWTTATGPRCVAPRICAHPRARASLHVPRSSHGHAPGSSGRRGTQSVVATGWIICEQGYPSHAHSFVKGTWAERAKERFRVWRRARGYSRLLIASPTRVCDSGSVGGPHTTRGRRRGGNVPGEEGFRTGGYLVEKRGLTFYPKATLGDFYQRRMSLRGVLKVRKATVRGTVNLRDGKGTV